MAFQWTRDQMDSGQRSSGREMDFQVELFDVTSFDPAWLPLPPPPPPQPFHQLHHLVFRASCQRPLELILAKHSLVTALLAERFLKTQNDRCSNPAMYNISL